MPTSQTYYEQGLRHAKNAEWGQAITCFKQALSLDPSSPAAEPLSMVQDILNYFHKDNFNP